MRRSLIASQPLAAWKDYLRFHELDRHADVLPKAFAEAARDDALAASPTAGDELRPESARTERARKATLAALSDEIGQIYTDRYFPPAAKARVDAIVADVVAAFRRRVETVTWMSPADPGARAGEARPPRTSESAIRRASADASESRRRSDLQSTRRTPWAISTASPPALTAGPRPARPAGES